jgi:hypothetical protein
MVMDAAEEVGDEVGDGGALAVEGAVDREWPGEDRRTRDTKLSRTSNP